MKKRIVALLFCFLTVVSLPTLQTDAAEPTLTAEAAILMNASTGEILYEKNKDKQMYPASITKIMTILLGIERNEELDVIVPISDEAINSVPRDTSHIALNYGEEVRLRDLLYATMMPSANDAANGIAEYTGGTLEQFATMMNNRAAELGCTNTHFTNANGLPDENHYTSAYDMALITREAIRNPIFAQVFGQVIYEMESTNKQPEKRSFATLNLMMKNSEYKYEGNNGGKTGWTTKAGYTFVTTAQRGMQKLIVVIMNASSAENRFKDAAKLFDYGFEAFDTVYLDSATLPAKTIPVVSENTILANIKFDMPDEGVYLTVPKGVTAQNITVENTVPNMMSEIPEGYSVDVFAEVDGARTKVGTFALTMEVEQLITETDAPAEDAPTEEKKGLTAGNIVAIVAIVLGAILLLLFILHIISNVVRIYRVKMKHKKKRMEQKRQQHRA